jgi:predicted nuclease with TOPRIM domain
VREELVDLREKYSALKKRVKQVEKDNDELFAENTRIEKQLTACRTQLRHYEETAEEAPAAEEAQLQPGEGRGERRGRGES